MESGALSYKILWYRVLSAMMSNSFVNGVTFSTSTTASGFTDDDSDGNTFTWAVGENVAVTITTDAFAVGSTVNPALHLQLTDARSPISCDLSVGDSTCTPTCTTGTVTCTKGNPSGILQVQFTLASIPASYNGASLTFTLSGSTVSPWDYGTKQFAVSGCPTTFFEGSEVIASTSETCGRGCIATFTCTDRVRYTCGQFSRTCQANAQWNDVSTGCTLCSEICTIERATIVATAYGCIQGTLLLIWTILVIKRVAVDNGEVGWYLALGVIGWAVYITILPVLTLTGPECCCTGELTAGGIVGIVLGCLNTPFIMLSLYFMICRKN